MGGSFFEGPPFSGFQGHQEEFAAFFGGSSLKMDTYPSLCRFSRGIFAERSRLIVGPHGGHRRQRARVHGPGNGHLCRIPTSEAC